MCGADPQADGAGADHPGLPEAGSDDRRRDGEVSGPPFHLHPLFLLSLEPAARVLTHPPRCAISHLSCPSQASTIMVEHGVASDLRSRCDQATSECAKTNDRLDGPATVDQRRWTSDGGPARPPVRVQHVDKMCARVWVFMFLVLWTACEACGQKGREDQWSSGVSVPLGWRL